MDYHLKVFHGRKGIEQISAVWAAVVDQMDRRHFYHFKDWYASYIETLEPVPDDVVFCVIHEGEKPVAILPFKQETRTVGGLKVRSLELPRDDHMLLRDIMICDSATSKLTITVITDLLKKSRELRWDVLALWHCSENSYTYRANKLKTPLLSICTRRFGSSYVPVQPWQQFNATLSRSFRQNQRTAHNRAEAFKDLQFEIANTPQQLETALNDFLDVEASGWKGEQGTAIKQDKRQASFYKGLTQRFGLTGRCEIHLLKIAGKPIAGLFLMITDNTVYIPKLGYDEEFSRISPVHLLLENLFKQCDLKGIKEVNLTSDAVWFNVWKPLQIGAYNIYVFNTTICGLAAGTAMGLANKGNRLRSVLNWFTGSAR